MAKISHFFERSQGGIRTHDQLVTPRLLVTKKGGLYHHPDRVWMRGASPTIWGTPRRDSLYAFPEKFRAWFGIILNVTS